MLYKCSINQITNPNPVTTESLHTHNNTYLKHHCNMLMSLLFLLGFNSCLCPEFTANITDTFFKFISDIQCFLSIWSSPLERSAAMVSTLWQKSSSTIGFFLLCRQCQRLPLWSSGQSSWLQIQRSRFDPYQIF
jgi:hypothetical protein